MPRGERPLDEGDSPLLQFAGDLRRLRAEAGSPTYRVLAQRAHFAITTLSEAASGRKLPGLDVTLAYVRACGGDEDTWAQRWHEVDESLFQSRVSPSPYVGLSAFTRGDADRTVLAAAGLGYYEIRLWDVVRWTSLPPLRMERLKQSLAFTPDGRLVVLTDSSLRLWSRGSVPMTSGHAVRALAVDRDGTVLTFDNGGFIERRDAGMNRVSRVATGAATLSPPLSARTQNWSPPAETMGPSAGTRHPARC